MCTIQAIFPDDMRIIPVQNGMLLCDALRQAGIPAPTPCGGTGKCGKCAVRAAGGLLPPPDGNGLCLSCQTKVIGDAIVWLGEADPLQAIEGMGALPEFPLDPLSGEYGLAIDIGTTTVAMQLVHLPSGKLIEAVTAENPQRSVAHDVIGRIQAALAGKDEFQKALIEGEIARMTAALCARAGVHPEQIAHTVCTGNTTMLYLLTGRSTKCLSAAPFRADCLFDTHENGRYLPPCFGAYVGADISCAVLASDMLRRHRTALLIDIGTNGESCLWHDGELLCCATAAGPAFEGVGISCGVSSVQGAIESVRAADGKLVCSTIGDETPVGLCGSGLIDAVAALLELEWLDNTGYLEDEEITIAEGVILTQKDIRMIQLAKGSICAGVRSLMNMAGVAEDGVEAVYIAGGFGRHIDLRSATRIGLLPQFPADRVHAIGNAALAGAVMLLLNRSAADELRDMVSRARCINLAQLPEFQNLFAEAMLFPEE